MDQLTTRQKIFIGLAAAAVWIGVAVFMFFYPLFTAGKDIITAAQGIILSLSVTHISSSGASGLADIRAQLAAITARFTTPPPDKGQGGRAQPMHLILVVICIVLVLFQMTGCASLTDAGHTAYSFEPTIGADGKATGNCKFTATDGKEYASRSIAATSTTDGCQVIVQEGPSTAFQGQAIAGKALSVLPSFAPLLLPQGPASLAVPSVMPRPPRPPAIAPGVKS